MSPMCHRKIPEPTTTHARSLPTTVLPIPLFTVALLLFFQFVRYTTSPFLLHTPASSTFSGPDMPSKTFVDAVPGLLWLGLCRTAALVRGASVGHIPARCGTSGVVDARPVRQKHPVKMDIPVLRLVDGHLHQHINKCLVYPLYHTVTLWVVGRNPGLGNAEQPAYLSYHLCLEVTALV
ncbi:hypothetical protein Tsp_05055 [Trichinella spiralis]|uniref:hypothetical protein n=1 Tax=Trichinella spiralis TaxID=6334 RepID=UPI0001EFECED|nr:hypothetical protein Tsp_05055 [Trichinella spiralis]